MHKLFRKKPPLWYVLRPGRPGDPHNKEGPYERSTIATMYRNGQLGGGALIWTNEKILYNPKKPGSSRLSRMDKWCRFDELPDPTQNQILSSAQPAQQPEAYEQQEPPPPPTASTGMGYGGTNQGPAPNVPPPGSGHGGMAYGQQRQHMAHAPYPPPGGGMVQQPMSYAPYPAAGVPQPSAPPAPAPVPAMGQGPGMLPPPPPPGMPPPMHQPYPGSYPAAPTGYPGAQR